MKVSASRKSVLIIDDEEELCMLMELVLEKHFRARSIHQLETALHLIEQLKPDYIFLDNHLPDGKGIDFIKKMIDAWPQTKIVMMTAHDEKKLNEKAIEEGASYFLHKPFNRNNIENIINSL
ncbi:MAG: response regulator [Chitinophagaceae bacterium]